MEHPTSIKWQWQRGNDRCIFNSWHEAMLFAILISKYRVSIRLLRNWFHYEGLCTICGREVSLGLSSHNPLRATLDHIMPLCKGGKGTNTNLQLAHDTCNRIKGHRSHVSSWEIELLKFRIDKMQGKAH